MPELESEIYITGNFYLTEGEKDHFYLCKNKNNEFMIKKVYGTCEMIVKVSEDHLFEFLNNIYNNTLGKSPVEISHCTVYKDKFNYFTIEQLFDLFSDKKCVLISFGRKTLKLEDKKLKEFFEIVHKFFNDNKDSHYTFY